MSRDAEAWKKEHAIEIYGSGANTGETGGRRCSGRTDCKTERARNNYGVMVYEAVQPTRRDISLATIEKFANACGFTVRVEFDEVSKEKVRYVKIEE